MKIILITLTAFSVSGCISYLNKEVGLQDDNIIEEVIEFAIERKIGIDIDLTPTNKEP